MDQSKYNMEQLNGLTKKELLEKCKEFGIGYGYTSKKKSELIEILHNYYVSVEQVGIEEHVVQDPLMDSLNNLLKIYTSRALSEKLNLAPGTITRWIELGAIPKNYEFDILKLENRKIDYSKYTAKEKDQFFTPAETAKKCFATFCDIIRKYGDEPTQYTYVEPSAGDGSFLSVLPASVETIAMDIEPRNSQIMCQDYLEWLPTNGGKYVVIGNPPFGLRGHTALKFINHSYSFADYVCFILPQLFESDGKGVPRKRVEGYALIFSEKLESEFYEPDGRHIRINTIFQIWSKYHVNEEYTIKKYSEENVKIYSMSDGGTVSTTRNKNMIGKCDVYIPSTCFGKENMRCYEKFEDLPGKKGYGVVFYGEEKHKNLDKMRETDWTQVAFLSTNSAYNLRSSQIHELFMV